MKILWVRILIAGIVLELLYGLYLVFILGAAEMAFMVQGIISAFVFMMIGGLWLASEAKAHRIGQAALVGVAAVLFYTILTIPGVITGELEITPPFLVNHAAKILGATAGGLVSTLLTPKKNPEPASIHEGEGGN
jgi:hypothetical protein